ncbi:hypothetical protein CPB83DRAFT_140061 [Crepidotus variabilis]|uniref:Uncharacterized protein n=1 Tax=Crepidotus variabilis TaxID=179855 RepID=A0A9P6JIL5_9AGAR|nr:hypothetical protein CPB83DRAFT_140061 [Crepidotus variabilis]
MLCSTTFRNIPAEIVVLEAFDAHKEQIRHEVSAAVWWMSSQVNAKQGDNHCIQGEIHLDSGLHPSTTFPSFSVDYVIEILTPNIPGLKPQTTKESKLQNGIATYPIEVLAFPRSDEPIHKTFTRYTQTRSKPLTE